MNITINIFLLIHYLMNFPGGSDSKESANARDSSSIPGSGRSSRVGNGNPLQYSCLGNARGRRARWATVHWVAESQILLSDETRTIYGIKDCFQTPLRAYVHVCFPIMNLEAPQGLRGARLRDGERTGDTADVTPRQLCVIQGPKTALPPSVQMKAA